MAYFLFRVVLVSWLIIALVQVPTVINAAGPVATPTPSCRPDEFFDPVMQICRPLAKPCPPQTIDINGNGVDDGAGDCQTLDRIARPDACRVGSLDELRSQNQLTCGLPWVVGGRRLTLSAAPGCLDVRRSLYPRAIVGLPVEFSVDRIIPPGQLAGVAFGQPGSYRISSSQPWTTEGLYLHERYGAGVTDAYGRRAFDTRTLLAGDAHPYPSLNNVRAHLEFRLKATDDQMAWVTERLPQAVYGGLQEPVEFLYPRASFPLPEYGELYTADGPAQNGANILPAFKLWVRTQWQLVLLTEWDTYTVSANNAYIRNGHVRLEVPLGGPYASLRAWDSRQTNVNVAEAYCNASEGYIPVPVIEAQAVLQP